MARRPLGYGMTAEVKRKMDSKYNQGDADKAVRWMNAILQQGGKDRNVGQTSSSTQLQEELKNGVILCEVINVLQPNSVRKINESKMAFKMMENIGNFLDQSANYGCNKTDMFQTVDLYEGQNMAQVVNGILALASKAASKGVTTDVQVAKLAEANKREFTEEQIKEGQNIIGLQMGTNKVASQAGMTGYGMTRQINPR
ncbi:transgelin-3-like isoform X3 [Anneissia japonica]|uniref:transgelin-3-like isoform X3 n=1 Tax=Anneissia japonica TaxID=1529436 RepID=UPI00142599D8|nr:transgelin-3-like isoform X3 [Anneissia japonica]